MKEPARLMLGDDDRPVELPEVGLRGTGLHPFTAPECVDYILDELDRGRGGWLIPSDLRYLLLADRDPGFRSQYDAATLRVPAARVLAWAGRLQRTPLPERISIQHLLLDLAAEASAVGRSVFVIARSDATAASVAEALQERFPYLMIKGAVGASTTVLDEDATELTRLSQTIAEQQPDLVFTGLEPPLQEILIGLLRHQDQKAWWIGAHNGLHRVAGLAKSSPKWMRSPRAELLHDMLQEPGELFSRYVMQGLPHGLALLFRCGIRGMLPKGKTESRYGRRKPRALLVDDDKHALAHLELLISSRYPEVEITTRVRPDVSGIFDFYFLDNDFNGERLATRMAGKIRAERPAAIIIAFSGVLDIGTLKGLINVGCDGVCDKADPMSWQPILEVIDRRLLGIIDRHALDRQSFGGVRNSAKSIQRLLRRWNKREEEEELQHSQERAES